MKLNLIPLFLSVLLIYALPVWSQPKTFEDSLELFRKTYIDSHAVIKQNDQQYFAFFEPTASFRVSATYTPVKNGKWFTMKTSGSSDKLFKTIGKLRFDLAGKSFELNVYQPQNPGNDPELENYLFLPFTDNTNGIFSYEGGRYIDLKKKDIRNNEVTIDFNKAYNPLCVYASGYNCPIPPAENYLDIEIVAGEKKFKKPTLLQRVGH